MALAQPRLLARSLRLLLWLIAVALIALTVFTLLTRSSGPRQSPLDRRIAKVNFRNAPLDQALGRLGGSVGMKVFIDRNALREAGVNLNEPINLLLHDVTLGTAFSRLDFERAEPCVMKVNDDVLFVTCESALPSPIRVYDVSDLVDQWMVLRRQGKDTGRSSVQGDNAPLSETEFMERVAKLITDMVDPDVWEVSGGTEGIHAFARRLVISGRPATHRKIHDLLEGLRRSNAPDAGIESRVK